MRPAALAAALLTAAPAAAQAAPLPAPPEGTSGDWFTRVDGRYRFGG